MKRLGWFLRRGWILLAIANAASAGWCNSVSIGETAGYPGKTVSLPVVIDTSAPCAGLNLWLEYDSGILGSPGVFPGEILTGAHEVLFSSPEAGKLNIVVVDPSGASTFSALSGTALYLTFVIEGSALDQSFSDISYAPMVQGPLFIFPAGMSNVTGESLSIVSQTPGRVTISLARVPDRWVEGYGPGAGYSHEQHIRLLADVNGNGMEDIVAFGNPGVQVAVSTGSAFQHGGWWDRLMSYDNAWRVEKHPRLAADMNGDGMADIVGFGDRGVFMGFSTGSGFTAPALQVLGFGYRDGWRVRDEVNSGTYDLDEIWTAAEQFCLAQQFTGQYVEHPRGAFDINGDGALDIAGFGPGGVTVALNNGDGTFQDASVWFAGWHESDGWRAASHVRTFADLNGDGFLDIVGIGQRKVAICLCEDTNGDGLGDAYLTPQGWEGDFSADRAWQVALHPRMTAGLNGDDLADLVCFGDRGVLVSLCDGSNFLAPEQRLKNQFCRNEGWVSPVLFPRGMVDMDGDGDDDILGIGEKGVYVSLGVDNTGDGHADSFTSPEQWADAFGLFSNPAWDPTRHLRLVGDVDGDYIPEIVGFYDDGVYVF